MAKKMSILHVIFLLIVIVIACSLFMAFPKSCESMANLDNSAPLSWEMGQGQGGESWTNRALQYAGDMKYNNLPSDQSAKFPGTPVPLPEGQLFFFANNKFNGECCPSQYSSSTGCACITNKQADYLLSRGGNSTLFSEF